MWVLSHISTGRRFYMLSNTKKYTVGRSIQCDLSLSDDISVSREHAVIHRSSSGIRVEDSGSKYGVYVNTGVDTNKKILINTLIDLQVGNIVRFGKMENTFRLENIDVKVVTSTMLPQDVDKLKKQLKIINGTLETVWTADCTHLVMPNVTITVKVLQSLASGVPIVSPSYFDVYIKYATENRPELPNVNNFVPEITEPYIIKEPGMMEVHLDRRRLFQNKTFVFMVKRHMERFEAIIKLAAGKCINIEEDKLRKSLLLKSEYIPVQFTPIVNSQCSSDIERIIEYIQSNNRRLINESEIGLAIIHRAIDRFCNPDRKMVNDFEPASFNTIEAFKNVLMEGTPTPVAMNIEKATPVLDIIPETVNHAGSESNNNLRNNEAIDLNEPVISTTRQSTRSSTKAAPDAIFIAPQKVHTPKKNQKRKHVEQEENQQENVEQAPIESEPTMSHKKNKTQDSSGSQGESGSANLIEQMVLPMSQSDHNFSGFISTQNRFNRNRKTTQNTSPPAKRANTETSKTTRKRAISMLTADSDENKDDDDGEVFNFGRRSKRTKVTSKGTQQRSIIDGSDDEEDGAFHFSKTSKRQSQPKQKSTQNKKNSNDVVDATEITSESQNSYKKPFQQPINRSFNRTLTPVEIVSAPKCDAEWISSKFKKELNLNDSTDSAPPSSSVRIKEEKLDEWELTDEEKKRQWIKSLGKVFEIRKIEMNMTHRSMDETDCLNSKSGNNLLNKSKNFKRFVKKNNFIPRTMIIKTHPVPITVSTFARI